LRLTAGQNDAIFNNASTFKVEMDDTTKILNDASPRTLVVLDELGRGTSSHDGTAIAFAVLHHLASRKSCIGFFASHYNLSDFTNHSKCAFRSEMLAQCNFGAASDHATWPL
jgi:DNA mismatch repair protein MSH6